MVWVFCFAGCLNDPGDTEFENTEEEKMAPGQPRISNLSPGKRYMHPLLSEGDSLLNENLPGEALTSFDKYFLSEKSEKRNDGRILALIGVVKACSAVDSSKGVIQNMARLDSIILTENFSPHLWEDILLFYGDHYFDIGSDKGVESLEAYKTLLEVRKKLYGNRSLPVAETHALIGKVYRYLLSGYSQAKVSLHKSIDIYDSKSSFSRKKYFYALYWLASTYNKIGDFANAQVFGDKAYEVAKDLPEPNVDELSRGLMIIGLIKRDLLKRKESNEYFKKLIPLEGSFQWDSRGSDFTYNNIGGNYLGLKQYDEARKVLYKSLSINRSGKKPSALRLTLRNLGALHFQTGQLDSAMYYYRKALILNEEEIPDDRIQIAHFNHSIGGIHALMNNPDSALIYYQKALYNGFPDFKNTDVSSNPHITVKDSNHELFNILSSKGDALQVKFSHNPGNIVYLEQALECYLKADSVIMMNRASFDHEASKLNMASVNYRDVYADALECVYTLDSLKPDPVFRERAFLFMEKNKSMILFEALSKNNQFKKSGIDTVLRNQELKLIEKISINEFQKNKILKDLRKAKANNEPGKIARLEKVLEEEKNRSLTLNKEGEKLKKALKAKEPEYYNQKYGGDFQDLNSVAQRLHKPNRAVIEFFKADRSVYVLTFVKGHSNLEKVILDDSLRQAISFYKNFLKTGLPGDDQKAFEQYLQFNEVAYSLFQKLIERPLQPLGELPESLIVILDPSLGSFPVESLIRSKTDSDVLDYRRPDYLIRSSEIGYAFSSNILVQNLNTTKNLRRSRPEMVSFSYLNTEKFGSLPGAEKEVMTIKNIMGGLSYEGERSTKKAFKKAIKEKNIIHLAIHGKGDTTDTYSSYLQFVNNPGVDNGRLFAYDLYNLDIDAQLVVLSACETGVGAKERGEGIYSIARGFAFAGCPSQIITFWKINDRAATRLMEAFYHELAQRNSVGSSIRKAKVSFIENHNEYFTHPSNWAAFIALGNNDLSFKKARN